MGLLDYEDEKEWWKLLRRTLSKADREAFDRLPEQFLLLKSSSKPTSYSHRFELDLVERIADGIAHPRSRAFAA